VRGSHTLPSCVGGVVAQVNAAASVCALSLSHKHTPEWAHGHAKGACNGLVDAVGVQPHVHLGREGDLKFH